MSKSKPPAADLLGRIEDWYLGECNGDWEHSYGIKIDTLDNPGWLVTIDLAETKWKDLELDRTVTQRTDTDWVQIESTKSQFIGCGGPRNLVEVLERFLKIVGA